MKRTKADVERELEALRSKVDYDLQRWHRDYNAAIEENKKLKADNYRLREEALSAQEAEAKAMARLEAAGRSIRLSNEEITFLNELKSKSQNGDHERAIDNAIFDELVARGLVKSTKLWGR